MADRPYRNRSAEDILAELSAASQSRRDDLARLMLYSTHDRPEPRSEQQKLMLALARLDSLRPADALNAKAAAAHKSLELQDETAIRDLLPLLETGLDGAEALPWAGGIRKNRVHVGFSLAYVLLLCALYDGAPRFDAAAARIRDRVAGLPVARLGAGFYRTSANVTKCLGLIGVRALRGGDAAGAENAAALMRQVQQIAVETKTLREGDWPPRKYWRSAGLAASGRIDAVTRSNEFKEAMRAHRIAAALEEACAAPPGSAAARDRAGVALLASVSHAHPGSAEAQVARFDALFPGSAA